MSDAAAELRRLAAAERFIEVGQHDRALETLAGLTAETAASSGAIRLRGFAHIGREDYDRAAAAAREGLVDEPSDIGLLYLLSLAEERRDALGEAERAILAALAQAPEQPELLAHYAGVLMRAGQLDKADRVLGRAAAADPDSPDVLDGRIALAYLRHDDRRARELTDELLARDPESLRGHRMLGALELQRGAAGSAAARFADVVRADPSDADLAGAARAARVLRSPIYWPSRVIARYGVAQTWIAAVVVIFGLRAVGLPVLAGIAGLAWLVFCLISWVAVAHVKRVERT